MYTQKELIERYVLGAWFLKIRLMSCRRQLWARELSLIHVENAALQMRKMCEMISYMCVIAAGIEQGQVPKSPQGYKVGAVLKYLKNKSILNFPLRARLTQGANSLWTLNIEELDNEDISRVKNIHERTHTALHEIPLFKPLPSPADAPASLFKLLNSVRDDHQWFWNRFCQHAVMIKGTIFFIDFQDMTTSKRPLVVKQNELSQDDIEIEFDPDFLADFTGNVNWNDFSD